MNVKAFRKHGGVDSCITSSTFLYVKFKMERKER